ncbi:hypothetical protein MJN76_33830, partial [Salmonella enterica subsp. enterica serovar Anatum]|nr:hypothetical protein [Salmonella enterica subsp. enterica serovar Anatum]
VDLLGKGDIDAAYEEINKSIELEMSWFNYVLLGKVYEMKGENPVLLNSIFQRIADIPIFIIFLIVIYVNLGLVVIVPVTMFIVS